MEDILLRKIEKKLAIGDFVISCSKHATEIKLEIPYAGMAFYEPEEKEADFVLEINEVEPDDSGKLLFGSFEYRIPTFLYERENGALDWMTKDLDGKSSLSFRISNNWKKFTLYEDNTGTNGVDAFHEFGSIFSYAILNHHACVLHGVVMEYEGKGILVTASSGTGKTTHTRMWRNKENALIINGDRCLCRKIDGVWYAYGMPWSGSSGEYINRRVQITAIVCLKQGIENVVRRMSIKEGTIAMMQRIFAPIYAGELQNKAFDICEELGKEIPILELSCRPDYESVQVLKEAILKLGDDK